MKSSGHTYSLFRKTMLGVQPVLFLFVALYAIRMNGSYSFQFCGLSEANFLSVC